MYYTFEKRCSKCFHVYQETRCHPHILTLVPLPYINVGVSPSKKICVICFIKNPLKMMKNALYVILKALFVLMLFRFLS